MAGRIVITGGCGNLGSKLAKHLASLGRQPHIFEQPGWFKPENVGAGWRTTVCDMRESGLSADGDGGAGWAEQFEGAQAVVHYAAQHPYPEASWEDAAKSIDMTNNVFAAAVAAGVPRVVLASSNHVMGGHKDDGTGVAGAGAAPIAPGSAVAVGTRWYAGGTEMDSTAYAAAKLAGERLARSLAQEQDAQYGAAGGGGECGGGTSFVVVRVGWCQPGENTPATMDASGTVTLDHDGDELHADPKQREGDAHSDPALLARWYRSMWLSNADHLQLMTCAVDAGALPGRHLLVNGNSNNSGMRWSHEGWDALGYAPVDDAYDEQWL